MGTINDKLTYLEGTKTAIKNAIIDKGVAVSANDTFRSYANKISTIQTGENLNTELNAQDSALSTQQTKIDQLETALDNKIALDLVSATSDANATADDIAKNKTAYVNGVKLSGTLEVPEKIVLPDGVRFTNSIATNMDWLENVDTTQLTTMTGMFDYCIYLTSIPEFDTSNMTNMQVAFRNCIRLSNEGLNTIMQLCINATKITTNKTLKNIGLSQAQAEICQTLSNWSAFVAAGWSTGY